MSPSRRRPCERYRSWDGRRPPGRSVRSVAMGNARRMRWHGVATGREPLGRGMGAGRRPGVELRPAIARLTSSSTVATSASLASCIRRRARPKHCEARVCRHMVVFPTVPPHLKELVQQSGCSMFCDCRNMGGSHGSFSTSSTSSSSSPSSRPPLFPSRHPTPPPRTHQHPLTPNMLFLSLLSFSLPPSFSLAPLPSSLVLHLVVR